MVCPRKLSSVLEKNIGDVINLSGKLLVVFLVLISTVLIWTVQHENAHKRICQYTGGVNQDINISFGPREKIGGIGFYTECEKMGNLKLHGINEVYGYQLLAVILSLDLIFGIWVMAKW